MVCKEFFMNIINVEHLYKIYGEKIIFDDASFGIQKGDKIVTTGGIYGKVAEIQEFAIIMEVEGGVRLKIDKAAVIKDMTDAAPAK